MIDGLVQRALTFLFGKPHDIYDERDGKDELYLRRWFLLGRDDSDDPLDERTGRLVIHRISLSDDRADCHDHPMSFLTCVLWGGYYDDRYFRKLDFQGNPIGREGPMREDLTVGKVRYRDAEHLHQVVLKGKTAWTLVWMRKPHRTWGFVLEDGTYVDRKEYKAAGRTM